MGSYVLLFFLEKIRKKYAYYNGIGYKEEKINMVRLEEKVKYFWMQHI